jgi:hypothetical protein
MRTGGRRKRQPWRFGVALLAMASVFLSGCVSKEVVHDSLLSAREKTVEGWVPLEGETSVG